MTRVRFPALVGLAGALAACVALGACSTTVDVADSGESSVGDPVATTVAPALPADGACSTLPKGCAPRPTEEQSRLIEAAVAAFYPGVPPGKATDWAFSTCLEIRDGRPPESVLRSVTMRFTARDRPTMTTEQAEQVVLLVTETFCRT